MRKRLPIILLIACVLSSCDKMPMNGDLDGMWQLMSEQWSDSTANRKEDKVYLSFMLHTAQFDKAGSTHFYSEFSHQGDTIVLYNICHKSQTKDITDTNDPVTEDELSDLQPWGIYSLNPSFHVDQLSKETLILTAETCTLCFRKF